MFSLTKPFLTLTALSALAAQVTQVHAAASMRSEEFINLTCSSETTDNFGSTNALYFNGKKNEVEIIQGYYDGINIRDYFDKTTLAENSNTVSVNMFRGYSSSQLVVQKTTDEEFNSTFTSFSNGEALFSLKYNCKIHYHQ